jgi:hypothetical protein
MLTGARRYGATAGGEESGMGLRERLFGTGTLRKDAPEVEERANETVRGVSAVLRGKRTPPPRLCADGHPVPTGSNMCGHGHYVGRA